METCVLIPAEFSLVLTGRNVRTRSSTEDEVTVAVWSNQRIARGARFLPFQGTIRLDQLDVFGHLHDEDIRHRFGCYDEIQQLETKRMRHCNWIRFVRFSPTFSGEVNLLGSLIKGEPVYETIRAVSANTEMVVYYEDESECKSPLTVLTPRNIIAAHYRHAMGMILEESPLDLSKSLLSSPITLTETCSAEEGRPVPTRVLMTPPSETEERRSVSSDGFSAGEEPVSYDGRPAVIKKGRERTLLPCDVCGKAFDRPSLLRRHMRTHTGEKPHVCEVCGKGFSTSSSLNTHRRIHSGEKPHQCHVCGKRFTASSNLYYHRMTHSKEKPHKCSLCSKSFPTPGDLKSHMYVHNGSWPFKCHICNRGFSKQTNLKNHLFLHTGDKPHVCEFCQKRFALACNLRAHLKTHEGEVQERCTQCGKSYPTSAHMLTHGYCHPCYQSSNGIALTNKKQPEDSSESSSSPDTDSGGASLRATPLFMGMFDHPLLMRYREAATSGFLPTASSLAAAVKFLEEAAPVLSSRT